MKLTIAGAPQGKARPRVVRTSGISRSYTPEKTASYENLVKLEYQRQCSEHFSNGVPLAVDITAYFAPPASAGRRKTQKMLDGVLLPMKKPDWDNIGKIICDALNGIAYHDDAQIVQARVQKCYDSRPRVEVVIEELL